MKKTIEMIKQNTYEKKNNENTKPEALISNTILKDTEIQKVKHRYQDVNKNEVKFRGKI